MLFDISSCHAVKAEGGDLRKVFLEQTMRLKERERENAAPEPRFEVTRKGELDDPRRLFGPNV